MIEPISRVCKFLPGQDNIIACINLWAPLCHMKCLCASVTYVAYTILVRYRYTLLFHEEIARLMNYYQASNVFLFDSIVFLFTLIWNRQLGNCNQVCTK